MTKSELIQRIAYKQSQLVERDVELTVKMMLDQMAECLAGGGRIESRGFASFSLRYRPARVGRNPKTGTPVSVPARYAPSFKPGKRLRERVNREAGGALEAQRHAGGSGDAYPCPLSARFHGHRSVPLRRQYCQPSRMWAEFQERPRVAALRSGERLD